jgi:hypothetical protein
MSLRLAFSVVLTGLAGALVVPAGAAARPGAPAAARQARPALVALWHMDESSGNVMVDSVGGHNGVSTGVQVGIPGFIGSAYAFSRRSFVSVPSAKALNPGRRKLTVAIRLNTTLTPARPDWDLLRKGVFGGGVGDYKIEYQPTGRATCGFLGSSGSRELTAGPALNDGRWHTVQCVKTTTSIRLVVDGRTFSRKVRIGSISNHAPLVIGARPGSEFFQGALDEAYVQVG